MEQFNDGAGDHNGNEDDLVSRLTSAEIIAAKEFFKTNPNKALQACRLIAMNMAMSRIDNANGDEDGAARIFRDGDVAFASDGDARTVFIENVTRCWHEPLLEAIELPGDAWPKGRAPIDDWIDAIADLEEGAQTPAI